MLKHDRIKVKLMYPEMMLFIWMFSNCMISWIDELPPIDMIAMFVRLDNSR